ncbi:MAG TPA: glycosyltransferase [Gemmatimonadales bacterium]
MAHRIPAVATRGVRSVAALIDTTIVSGPGRQLAALAAELRRSDVEMRVALLQRTGRPRPPYADYLAAAGITHAVLPDQGPLDVGVVGRLRELLGEWAPDVIQTHSYRMTFVAAALRARGVRTPWVGFFHGATAEDRKVRLYHWLDRRALGRADAVVVMSRAHAEEFARHGRRVHVVHNAVIPLPRPADAGALQLPVAGGAPLLGVVGRLSHEKGVDVFLDACARLAARGVEFEAVVAGDGPERGALLARRDGLGLADRVHFPGVVTDVCSLYERLDLLVIPSRSEGLPNVLLEALSADTPVVSTEVGAVPEVITDPAAGLLVPPGDAEALADAIVAALPLRADAAAREARATTVERFSLATRADAMRRIYDSLHGVTR